MLCRREGKWQYQLKKHPLSGWMLSVQLWGLKGKTWVKGLALQKFSSLLWIMLAWITSWLMFLLVLSIPLFIQLVLYSVAVINGTRQNMAPLSTGFLLMRQERELYRITMLQDRHSGCLQVHDAKGSVEPPQVLSGGVYVALSPDSYRESPCRVRRERFGWLRSRKMFAGDSSHMSWHPEKTGWSLLFGDQKTQYVFVQSHWAMLQWPCV